MRHTERQLKIKDFDSKHPGLELETVHMVHRKRSIAAKQRVYTTKQNIYVSYRGERIGIIEPREVDVWNKYPYTASFYEQAGDERGEYAGHFNTLYAAKMGVLCK